MHNRPLLHAALVALAVASLVCAVWALLESDYRAQSLRSTDLEAQRAAELVERGVQARALALSRLAAGHGLCDRPGATDWAGAVRDALASYPSLRAVGWFDASLLPRSAVILEGESGDVERLRPTDECRTALAARPGTAPATHCVRNAGGGLLICVPVVRQGEIRGYLSGLIDPAAMMAAIFHDHMPDRALRVEAGGRVLYARHGEGIPAGSEWCRHADVALGDVRWGVAVWPGSADWAARERRRPDWVLLLGLLLALALGRSSYLAQVARIHAGNAEKSAQAVTQEIGEREQAERALRQSEERYRTLAESAEDTIFIMDRDDRILYVNHFGAQAIGRQAQDMIGKPRSEFMPVEVSETQRRNLLQAMETGESAWYESPLPLPDGPLWLHTKLVPLRDAAGAFTAVLGIARDITARKEVEDAHARHLREIERLNAELQAANAAKDEFVTILSHELRNPLAPILAAVDLLRPIVAENEVGRRLVQVLDESARLQARLVNDLLDLSRIARGKIEFRMMALPLDAIVRAVTKSHEADAASSELTLTVDAPAGIWVNADPDRMQQAVLNLLNNAIKFTPPGGQVRVGVLECGSVGEEAAPAEERPAHTGVADAHTPTPPHSHTLTPRRARVTVEDTGIGISEELLPRMFEMFQQGDPGGRSASGLGIGLAMVKLIVEKHGGRVWAESGGLGQGSRFTIELPMTDPPDARRPDEPEVPCPADGAEAPGLAERDALLLLVEDSPNTRAMLAESLAARGYRVQTATSAEEALEWLRDGRPDAILSDIGLPGIDGCELMRRVRRMPGMESVPAFAVTAFGQDADVRRAREAGFTDHLAKPVGVPELDRLIRARLAHGEEPTPVG